MPSSNVPPFDSENYRPHRHSDFSDNDNYLPVAPRNLREFYKFGYKLGYPLSHCPRDVVDTLYNYYCRFRSLPEYKGQYDIYRKKFPDFKDKTPAYQNWLKNVTRSQND